MKNWNQLISNDIYPIRLRYRYYISKCSGMKIQTKNFMDCAYYHTNEYLQMWKAYVILIEMRYFVLDQKTKILIFLLNSISISYLKTRILNLLWGIISRCWYGVCWNYLVDIHLQFELNAVIVGPLKDLNQIEFLSGILQHLCNIM